MDIGRIRRLVTEGRYGYSRHAERERELDMIYIWELEDALRNGEIIENYPYPEAQAVWFWDFVVQNLFMQYAP